ncbi:MAG: GIY-YIG nuclease family protein [Candidatus Sifarchaeia archaeon]
MYFVYIIETQDGSYYTGMTNDIARRFQEHLSGNSKSAAYLKMHKPEYVVYMTECETRADAMRLEQRIKKDYNLKMECVGPRRDIREVIETELSYK